MIDTKNMNLCTLCGSCYESCPKNAIKLEINKFGHVYPIIDRNLCINCGVCDSVCQIGLECPTREYVSTFLYKSIDSNVLKKSASGGFCYDICKKVLDNNGIVYGVEYINADVMYKRIDSVENLHKIQGSKYVKADAFKVFKNVKSDLNDKTVCFVGLPCEIAGLKLFLRKKYSNLITIGLLCGGSVPRTYFSEYMNYLKTKFGQFPKDYKFRDKKYGAHVQCTSATFEEKKYLNGFDNFFISLLGSKYVRPSCKYCSFDEKRNFSDFVVGDAFNVERGDGISIVFCFNKKCLSFISNKESMIDVRKDSLSSYVRCRSKSKSSNISIDEKEYIDFYTDYKSNPLKAFKKYIYKKYTLKQKIYFRLPYSIKRIKK